MHFECLFVYRCLSFPLSACASVYLSASVCLSGCLPFGLFFCSYIYKCLHFYLPACLSPCLFVYPLVCLSIDLSLSVLPASVCPHIWEHVYACLPTMCFSFHPSINHQCQPVTGHSHLVGQTSKLIGQSASLFVYLTMRSSAYCCLYFLLILHLLKSHTLEQIRFYPFPALITSR